MPRRLTENRCRDCAHHVIGHANDISWTTTVCEMKPKSRKTKSRFHLFYGNNGMGKPCEKFVLKPRQVCLCYIHLEPTDGEPAIEFGDKFTPKEIGAIHRAMWNYLKSINYQQQFNHEED